MSTRKLSVRQLRKIITETIAVPPKDIVKYFKMMCREYGYDASTFDIVRDDNVWVAKPKDGGPAQFYWYEAYEEWHPTG